MSLFDPEFYPTPKEVIAKMIAPYADRITQACILEPSAGDGAILDYLKEGVPTVYVAKNGTKHIINVNVDMTKVYACEHNPELQYILQKKGYRLVAENFLTFRPDIRFDLILMNPPFLHGDSHLLHAWEILPSGDIACLLNAETINNPCTQNRKLLGRIIQDNGSVEMLGKCFRSAENPTDVEVALVRLHKDAKEDPFRIDTSGLSREGIPDFTEMTDGSTSAVIQEGRMNAFLRSWEMAKKAAVEYIKAKQTLELFIGVFKEGRCAIDPVAEIDKNFANNRERYGNNLSALMGDVYNSFIADATRLVWHTMFKQMGIDKYMTSKLQQTLNDFRNGQSTFAVSKENIYKLLNYLMLNLKEFMDGTVVEVYDNFTRYFPGNTSWKEGWKTNKQFSCNKKIILPNSVSSGFMTQRYGYSSHFSPSFDTTTKLSDIDRAMCWLTGRDYDSLTGVIEIPGQGKTECPACRTICQTISRIPVGSTDWHESAFFHVKAFKKGTLHIEFKDDDLWAKFCLTVNKGKNQIGDSEAK